MLPCRVRFPVPPDAGFFLFNVGLNSLTGQRMCRTALKLRQMTQALTRGRCELERQRRRLFCLVLLRDESCSVVHGVTVKMDSAQDIQGLPDVASTSYTTLIAPVTIARTSGNGSSARGVGWRAVARWRLRESL